MKPGARDGDGVRDRVRDEKVKIETVQKSLRNDMKDSVELLSCLRVGDESG
jgi:hypothetical protein